ncbi:hypothetical protein KGG93_gp65 [Streptomyces phage Endor2]|uniref:Lipoprotein n=1 Tax=Streptomyces phage Endor2 TaxID=2740182 RepID=A0A7G4AX70_9CAUD|nr:hypothetical protein KGG93_gp65 [Streptomyces phage Endor2]QMP84610.1 hypothetical protein HUN44_00065 [Streptomyces phage Endor2]
MKILRAGSVAIVASLLLILLTGCDDRPCESGHYNYIPVSNGKTTTLHPYWVCDEYAEEK